MYMNRLSTVKSVIALSKYKIYTILPTYVFRVKSFSSTIPSSSNGISITNVGNVSTINDASRGYVFSFSGSNCFQISLPTDINNTKSFWVSSSTPSKSNGNIFSTTKCPIWFAATTYLHASPNFGTSNNVVIINTVSQTSTWIFYTVTSTATSTSLYMNGQLITSSALNWTGDTDTINIGAYQGTSFFTGLIDDIRYYSYAMSASDILKIYTTSLNNPLV